MTILIDAQLSNSCSEDGPTTPMLQAATIERKSLTIKDLQEQLEIYKNLLRQQCDDEEDEQCKLIKELAEICTTLQQLEQEQAVELVRINHMLEEQAVTNNLIKKELARSAVVRVGMVVAVAAEIIICTGLLLWQGWNKF